MTAWLLHLFLRPEFFLGLALIAFAGCVFFKLTLDPFLALLCELAAVLLLVVAAYAWAYNRGVAREHLVTVEVQAKFDTFVKEQAELAEAQRLRAVAASAAAEESARKRKEKQDADFAKLKRSARAALGNSGGVVVPGRAVELLNAGARAANAAGTPAQPNEAAAPAAAHPADTTLDTTLGVLTGWQLEVLEIHAECRNVVAGWVEWYQALRAPPVELTP